MATAKSLKPKASDFVALGDTSHTVTSVPVDMADFMNIQTDGGVHEFSEGDATDPDSYWENAAGPQSLIEDHRSGQPDKVALNKNSPSKPAVAGNKSVDDPGDDGLIDVEVL